MKKPPQNETLEQAAIRLESDRHAWRLREIKAMSARLKALQTYVPALEAAGVKLHAADIKVLGRQKPLHLLDGYFNRRQVKTTLEVLTHHGFKEIKRDEMVSYTVYIIAKGHLQIRLSLDKTSEEMGKAA
jgi:hypothetical protein